MLINLVSCTVTVILVSCTVTVITVITVLFRASGLMMKNSTRPADEDAASEARRWGGSGGVIAVGSLLAWFSIVYSWECLTGRSPKNWLKQLLFCIWSVFATGAHEVNAETRLSAKTKDGTSIWMEVDSNQPRVLPKASIVVCNDGAQNDIANLRLVAEQYFPTEKYVILDGRLLPEVFDSSSATFVFFGNLSVEQVKSDCVDKVPGFHEYISLRARLVQKQNEDLNAVLKKQFKTKLDVIGKEFCAPWGPVATIDGVTYNWSVQIRSSVTKTCRRSYWTIFGIDKLCLTDKCDISEEEKILNSLN